MNNHSKYRCIAMRNWRYYDELMLTRNRRYYVTKRNISICLTLKKNKDIRSN